MSKSTYELIIKKREGEELTKEEIDLLTRGFVSGKIPSYQMSAFLMAVYFKGMSKQETIYLTECMMRSGKCLNLKNIQTPIIDKHSTGGVGDKISLILAPLAASCGICVPMVSGRGLGHTGGTLDKLESIPGFRTDISLKKFKRQLEQIGIGMIGQTQEFVPADKKLYALRDVTGTVESIPLIASSIMSKKIAEGIEGLVLDVKTGDGAFMQDIEDATRLAKTMVDIGKGMGIKVIALITDMNQPLGYAIGNALEVIEAIEVLSGKGPQDVRELTCTLTGYMLYIAQLSKTPEIGKKIAKKNLDNGSALEKFIQLVTSQGGNPDVIRTPSLFPKTRYTLYVQAPKTGYITGINARELGLCNTLLGGGRLKVNDKIDHSSGIILHKKLTDYVKAGEILCTVYTNKKGVDEILKRISIAFKVSLRKPTPPKLIYRKYGNL